MLTTTEIIKKYNLYTKKSLGQNFLTNPDLLAKIVNCAGDLNNFDVLEIGTGPGGLTTAILSKNPKHLITVDMDERCKAVVENELKPIYKNIDFIYGDALKINENELFKSKYKIIANLPYNVGTTLLFKWLENIEKIESMTLLLQKEVVDRIVAKPKTKDYGRLSVLCQYLCNVKKCFDIQPSAFFPPPKVVSSVVFLSPKNDVDFTKVNNLSKLCRIIFNQRRKTILNNLNVEIKDAEKTREILEKCGINPSARAEELTIDNILNLLSTFKWVKVD